MISHTLWVLTRTVARCLFWIGCRVLPFLWPTRLVAHFYVIYFSTLITIVFYGRRFLLGKVEHQVNVCLCDTSFTLHLVAIAQAGWAFFPTLHKVTIGSTFRASYGHSRRANGIGRSMDS